MHGATIKIKIKTHSEYLILFFHGSSGYATDPACYVTRTLSVLFRIMLKRSCSLNMGVCWILLLFVL
jgi:hypothetical protein